MTTPEEKLAALLRAADVPTRGDGLSRIQARLVRRKRSRWIMPAAALATAGVAATVLVLAGDPGRDTLTITPASPSASAEATVGPTPTPCPTPVSGTTVCTSYEVTSDDYAGPQIWPAYQDLSVAQPWQKDGKQVAQRFVTDFLQLTGVAVGPPVTASALAGQGQTYPLRVAGRDVSLVTVEPLKPSGPWVVTQATAPGLNLTYPGFGESVSNPVAVTGTLDQGVHESVLLRLLTTSATQLAQTSAPAGSEAPWTGSLSWTDTSWTAGAVIGTTASDKDGSLTRLFAQPVVRATVSQVATFAGIVDGHVSTFATDGSVGQQLTYPPAGSRDVEASFNGSSALVVRVDPGTCRQRLIRLDGTTAGNLMEPGTASLRTPRLSPSGTWVAWVLTPCSGGASSVVVQQTGKPASFLTIPDGTFASVQSVDDSGRLMVQVGDGKSAAPRLLTRQDGDVTRGSALRAAQVCGLGPAAFDGSRIVAWESCGSRVHLVRYDGNGARVSVDPDVPLSDPPVRTSVNNGRVLAWLFGGDSVGEVARYQDGTVTVVVPNTGCTSVSEPKGCVRDPSW